jgi:hypothetical protein
MTSTGLPVSNNFRTPQKESVIAFAGWAPAKPRSLVADEHGKRGEFNAERG